MKYFNQKFNHILNKFHLGTRLHNSITTNYYITPMHTNISQFFRRVAKETLELNFAEVITIEKYMHAIGVITDDYELKDCKETSRKSQLYSSKDK